MSNPTPYNSPYGNTPQQDYGTQPQPNDAGQQGQGAYAQPQQPYDAWQYPQTQPQQPMSYAQPVQPQPDPYTQPQQPNQYAQQPQASYPQPNPSPYSQQYTQPQTQYATQPQQSGDTGSVGWGILGFFIPLVGLILWLVWKDTKPKNAKSAGIGALIGVGICVLWWLICILLVGAGAGSMYYYN